MDLVQTQYFTILCLSLCNIYLFKYLIIKNIQFNLFKFVSFIDRDINFL